MIRVLIAFIVLLGAVLLGIQLNYDPGYVLIAINHWTVETTLWVAIFGLLLLVLLVHLLLQLFHKVAKTPGTVNKWNSRRLAQKAQATTRKGLIEYSEGYWQKAKNHLIQALPNTDTPLLNYLTAARAAQKMGDSQLRDHYLREAQQSMPEAKIAVELTQAQLQLANHQWEQALATLRHLQDLAPRHPYVLKLLMHLYEEVRDWPQLIALLPDLKKHNVVSDNAFQQLQQNTYLQAMIDFAKQNQTESINRLYQSLPKSLVNNPEIVAEYVRFLCKNNEYTQAETILRRCLRKEYNSELINLYGLLALNEQQLIFAESLLKKNPHSAALFLCLGRLCIAQHLWGKAKQYLEQSNELIPTPAAFQELGKLYEKLNEPLLACDSFRKGLELATTQELCSSLEQIRWGRLRNKRASNPS
jgi:HemY protein